MLSQENKTLLHQEGTNKLLMPKRGGRNNFPRDMRERETKTKRVDFNEFPSKIIGGVELNDTFSCLSSSMGERMGLFIY